MKRPSFQFYPADWRNNAKLRRCSEAARGAWMDILCVLHDSDEYGVCRWPLSDLARAAGVSLKLVKELHEKDVLKGGENGCDPYIYTPVSGRVKGDPVVLLEAEPNKPCWYCSRFVRDEYVRIRRGSSTQFSEDNQPLKTPSKQSPNQSPKVGFGEPQGDGSTSSSTSTSKNNEQTHSNETRTSKEPTLAARVCMALKKQNITGINPSNPTLLALLDAGATVEEFENTAIMAKVRTMNYVIGSVKGMREQAASENFVKGEFKQVDNSWRSNDTKILEKAKELGVGTSGLSKFDLIAKIDAKLEKMAAH